MQKEIKEMKSTLASLPESIERLFCKGYDDVAVSISRSLERLEERIDAGESRIYSRLTDIENCIGEELKAVRLAVVGQEVGATD